jgi:hypothetical protein
MTDYPDYVKEALAAGRQVPPWIIERAQSREEFERLMELRERAFPATRPNHSK